MINHVCNVVLEALGGSSQRLGAAGQRACRTSAPLQRCSHLGRSAAVAGAVIIVYPLILRAGQCSSDLRRRRGCLLQVEGIAWELQPLVAAAHPAAGDSSPPLVGLYLTNSAAYVASVLAALRLG